VSTSAAWFQEWQEVLPGAPLRQGDLLESTSDAANPWDRHLVVITADCDLANSKHQGRVTCVPLLSVDEYLLRFTIPRLLEKVREKHLTQLEAICARSGTHPSRERLRAWPSEATDDEIVAATGVGASDAVVLKACTRGIRTLAGPWDTVSLAVKALTESEQLSPQPQGADKYRNSLSSALRSPFTNPPGDALFISAFAPGQDEGYFAYLRHIEHIHESDIATQPTRSEAKFRRLARFTDRFTYAIVQRFASVFATIGLPSDYEEMRNFYSDQLWERTK